MASWMAGRLDGWRDSQIGGRLDGWMDGCMDGWLDRWLTDWLLIDWYVDCSEFYDGLINWLIDWLIDWLNDQLIRFNFLLPWIIAVYQKVSYQTFHAENVFYEEKTVHNLGKARYQMDLVKSERFSITNEFAAAVCNLPQTYDRMAYHRFIKDWGTVGFWINFVTSLTFNLKKFGQVFTMASVHCVNEEYLFAKFWVIYIYACSVLEFKWSKQYSSNVTESMRYFSIYLLQPACRVI